MKPGKWKFCVSVVVGLFTLLRDGSCLVVAASAGRSVPLSDWMAPLPGTNRISELSIPGTHDSGALHEPWPNTAQCQVLSIPEQLAAGVRFLDIRCRHVDDAFKIYHGSADQRMTFDAVLADCLEFLKTHPGECIILSVQQESTPDGNTRTFEQTFDMYAKNSAGKWFLKDYIPALDEVRGKLVLFRRFGASGLPKGIDASGWHDNATFWIGRTIRIQDNYIVKDRDAKWAAIKALYAEEGAGKRDVLYLNFTSGYEPGGLGIPNIRAISNFINPQLTSYFQSAHPGRFGITVMDFVDSGKCALIVGTNR